MSTISRLTDRAQKLMRKAGWQTRALVARSPEVRMLYRDGDGWVAACIEPAFIDPVDGFVVTTRGRVLLEDSLLPNFEHGKATWRLGTPSPLRPISNRAEVVEYLQVVSLRHRWEWNYYHFFIDVLGKLDLLAEAGVDPDTPMVLGRYAHALDFAHQALACGRLRERRWVVPDADDRLVVRADRVIYCRTHRPFRKRIAHLLDEMDAPAPTGDDRVFLTRVAPITRRLANEDEVRPVLSRFGFRTVDAASMSIREQMETFAQARYVVALHGAGVTNIIFRCGGPLDLLELHSRGFAGPGDMLRICDELGFRHHSLSGEAEGGEIGDNYRIEPAELQRAIESML